MYVYRIKEGKTSREKLFEAFYWERFCGWSGQELGDIPEDEQEIRIAWHAAQQHPALLEMDEETGHHPSSGRDNLPFLTHTNTHTHFGKSPTTPPPVQTKASVNADQG